jgi:uncharacterized protein YsxB (DUF464 family)
VRPSRAISGIGQLGERLQGGGGDPLTFRETGDEARHAQSGRAGDDVVGCGAVSLLGRVSAHAVPDVAHKSVGHLACQRLFDLVSPTGFRTRAAALKARNAASLETFQDLLLLAETYFD